jgi:hypothetical protein
MVVLDGDEPDKHGEDAVQMYIYMCSTNSSLLLMPE